ncbi:hypothetical protein B0H19DRAFT_1138857 [Mycena capillaripes]|nr:hypothetical protein B0H19DRAFT_1138857 [Mycena capillaripes]
MADYAASLPTPPMLPEDLEREIFEISARSRPRSIPTFMLVAWRVKAWVEPLLYHTVVFAEPSGMKSIEGHLTHSGATLFSILDSKPASFFRDAVRNLLYLPTPDGKAVLSRCTGIENLWIAAPRNSNALRELLPLITALPLKHLYCNIGQLFGSPDFSPPLFTHLTHLELFDGPATVDAETWGGIVSLSNLTHLSFNNAIFFNIWRILLDKCPSLRVLVMIGLTAQYSLDVHPYKNELVRDPRFVMMNCTEAIRDWQIGVHSGADYWSRAEELIAKRRSGEVDALQYRIEDETEIADFLFQ